jgi:hypothetical protein
MSSKEHNATNRSLRVFFIKRSPIMFGVSRRTRPASLIHRSEFNVSTSPSVAFLVLLAAAAGAGVVAADFGLHVANRLDGRL